MAFRYGSWSQPAGYDTSVNLVDELKGGLDFGTGLRNEQDAKAALGDYVKSLYMGGQPTTVQPSAGTPAPGNDTGSRLINGAVDAATGATDPTLDAYFSSIRAAESGGNDSAKNSNSSATGRYQFTSGTWNGLMQQHPELGLTAEGRTDPTQQERAIRAFTNDNIGVLRNAGIPVNPGNLYASHFLGAGGATNVLGQGDDIPMSAAVAPEVIEANPFLADLTVGQFKQWAAGKAGNGQGGYQAPLADTPSAQPPAAGLPPRDVMMALFRNPETRGFAAEIVKATKAGGSLINAGDGNIYDPKTGQWVKAPGATQKAPTVVELFDEQTGQPYKATWNPETGQFERQGGIKAPSGTSLTVGPDGTVQFQQGGGKALTEGQSKDTVFATRAEGALPLLDQFGNALLDPVQQAMGADPTGLIRGRQTPEFQQAWQAGREFLQAILRKDTGAAITQQETDEYGKVYLPQPGDTPEVLAQKQASRARAVAAINAGMPPQAILNKEKALLESAPPQQGAAPEPGTVMDGYRFKGGDPADENNWEPV